MEVGCSQQREVIDGLHNVRRYGGKLIVHSRFLGFDFSFPADLLTIGSGHVVVQAIPAHMRIVVEQGEAILTSRVLSAGLRAVVKAVDWGANTLTLVVSHRCQVFSGQRELKRYFFDENVEVRLRTSGDDFLGQAMDISEGGLAIRFPDREIMRKRTRKAEVSFYLPMKRWDENIGLFEIRYESIHAVSRIIHAEHGSRGVLLGYSFMDIDFSQLTVIKCFILKREVDMMQRIFDEEALRAHQAGRGCCDFLDASPPAQQRAILL